MNHIKILSNLNGYKNSGPSEYVDEVDSQGLPPSPSGYDSKKERRVPRK